MEATIDEVGATLPTDEHTTTSADVANVGTIPSPGQLTPEHVCMEDIGTQLINIESIQQTIRTQVWKLENNDIETTSFKLRSLYPKLDALQNSLRKTFDAHTRPLIRIRHICKMPAEILRMIFEDVRGDFDVKRDTYPSDGIKAIQNLRLTCRRFCEASSPLLLHRLDVSLTASSLAHLDKVSRHPTISKGIQSLQICAGLYDPTLAESLQGFIDQVVEILRKEQMRDLDGMRSDLDDDFGVLHKPDFLFPADREHLSEVWDKMGEHHQILLSCISYLQAETYQPDDDQIMAYLSQVYRQYNQLLNDQHAFLQNDTFATSVAGAVARLPKVSGLSITDHGGFDLCPLWTELSIPAYFTLRDWLLRPSRWTEKNVSQLAHRAFEFLYQSLLAIFRADNSLAELRIRVDPTIDHEMRISPEQVRDLVSAARHLQVLEIDCCLTVQPTPYEYPSGERVTISRLASLFLSSSNLRSVTLTLGPEPEADGWKVEPSLALLPWANLRKISLTNTYIHFDELSTYLEKLTPGTCIHLTGMYLLSGLWVDLLDVIRAKADRHSNVIAPAGNEASERTEEFYRKFESRPGESSLATAYIRGEITDNPLRSPPDQGNMDTEGMEEDD